MSRMKIVLRQPVEPLGEVGDVVFVAAGYARNYLIPRGLAVVANKGNLKQAEDWAKSKGAKLAKARSSAEAMLGKLESIHLHVTAQAGPDGRLFGSITAADVSQALKAQADTEVDRHDIELTEPIRHLGLHSVKVRLSSEISADVNVEVSAAG